MGHKERNCLLFSSWRHLSCATALCKVVYIQSFLVVQEFQEMSCVSQGTRHKNKLGLHVIIQVAMYSNCLTLSIIENITRNLILTHTHTHTHTHKKALMIKLCFLLANHIYSFSN
jgi:hypothetical protein